MKIFISTLTVIFSLLLISNFSYSQEYLLMIDAGTYKVEEVQQAAEAYFQDKPKGKGSGYKQYKRWEYLALRMQNDEGYVPSSEFFIQELQAFNAQMNSNSNNRAMLNDSWVEMGPVNWNATSGWNPGVGRITAFSIDENNENHILVGAETGGVWRTMDGGQNWTPLSDYFSNLLVYATAIDLLDANTYYFGSTGGRVYKSTDAGATWSLRGVSGTSLINKILIHPADSNILFASSQNAGVYRSTNGGLNWTSIVADDRGYDIEFKPGDLNTVYVSGNQFHKSTDGGTTFTTITGFDNTGAKMIGVSADNPDIVYVLEEENSIFNAVYVSNDSGITFTKLNHGNTNFFGYSLSGEDNSGQAPRDMDIAINPNNANEVHIAGIHTWLSTDGGVSFVPTSHWIPGTAAANNIGYNHADVDIIAFFNNTLYTGTDGGIFKATNTTNVTSNYYTDITEGLGIRQFYKIGISQTDPVIVSGGSQDNGTSFYTSTEGWRDWLGADGMETFIDKTNSNRMYGTTQFGQLYRSSNGGISQTGLSEPGPGQGNWVTPFEQDPTEENTIYVGYNQIFKSTDSGGNWTSISQDFGGNLDHLKIATSNNNIMYASRANQLFKTTTGGGTWQQVTGFQGNINSIAIHPTNPDKVALATTGALKVYVTEDGGQNWVSYFNNLPNFQAMSVVWQDNGLDGLYLGMNYGIYYIDNTYTEWQVFNNNLPNVIINELEINYTDGNIYAATYGRGLWASPFYDGVLSQTEFAVFENLIVYPVPAYDKITISWNENVRSDIRIFDTNGKLLHFERDVVLSDNHQIDVSPFTSGIYFLRVNTEKGMTTKKIIIN